MGRYLIKGGETVWIDGPIVRALRTGAILYLDEIAEARPDAVVVIHSLTDHRRELYLDRTGETLKAPAAFMLVISFNPGYQRSMRERVAELAPSVARAAPAAAVVGGGVIDVAARVLPVEVGSSMEALQ